MRKYTYTIILIINSHVTLLANAEPITITLAGDIGLNPSNTLVNPTGVYDEGFQTWADTTALIAKDINGDLNFANIETVVTDRNDLPPDLKGQNRPFNFRMHPNGLKHLVTNGFNLLSLANNHSMDYGLAGLNETLKHVALLKAGGVVLATAGIGMNSEEASRPEVINVKGYKVAFSAIGIVTNDLERHRAGPTKPGQIAYRFTDDYALVRQRLVDTTADLRILSIHYGIERQVRMDAKQMVEWRNMAAQHDNIDIIIGHHAHVVRGVEMNGRSLIFYGLGNFLHHGTANITKNGICRNYGLLARVHLVNNDNGKLEIKAVEAIPVTNTHRKTQRIRGSDGIAHIHVLNYLAATLDNSTTGARGLRFSPQNDGSGLYCLPGAENLAGRVGDLCKTYHEPPSIPNNLKNQIVASCNR